MTFSVTIEHPTVDSLPFRAWWSGFSSKTTPRTTALWGQNLEVGGICLFVKVLYCPLHNPRCRCSSYVEHCVLCESRLGCNDREASDATFKELVGFWFLVQAQRPKETNQWQTQQEGFQGKGKGEVVEKRKRPLSGAGTAGKAKSGEGNAGEHLRAQPP